MTTTVPTNTQLLRQLAQELAALKKQTDAAVSTLDRLLARSNPAATEPAPPPSSSPLVCPTHGAAKVAPSEKRPNSLFCKAKQGDGYCTWTVDVAA